MEVLKSVPIVPAKGVSDPFWPDTRRLIDYGMVTPIISNFTGAALAGDPAAVAASWAGQESLLTEAERCDLARVAQVLSVRGNRRDIKNDYLKVLWENLRKIALDDPQLDAQLRDNLKAKSVANDGQSVSAFARDLGYPRTADLSQDPLRLLAELPLPLYITTSHHDFLEHALTKAGGDKRPVSEILYWEETQEWIPSIYDQEPDYKPDVNRPLVYHLFGRDEHPQSLVLTEDDYLDWLVKLSELPAQVNVSNTPGQARQIPGVVRQALSRNALLILGYGVYTWDFRVLFRSLILGLGSIRCRPNTHVPRGMCMQLEPNQGNGDALQRLREHFEIYFNNSNFDVFWGDERKCVTALTERWRGGAR